MKAIAIAATLIWSASLAAQNRFVVETIDNHRIWNLQYGEGKGVYYEMAGEHVLSAYRVRFKYNRCESFNATETGKYGYRADKLPNGHIMIETFPPGSAVPNHCELIVSRPM